MNPAFEAALSRVHVEHTERLHQIACPFDLLVEVERQQRHSSPVLAVRFARKLYPRFISLAASYPRADQDALVHVGKRIFRVTIPAMRQDIREARALEALRREEVAS